MNNLYFDQNTTNSTYHSGYTENSASQNLKRLKPIKNKGKITFKDFKYLKSCVKTHTLALIEFDARLGRIEKALFSNGIMDNKYKKPSFIKKTLGKVIQSTLGIAATAFFNNKAFPKANKQYLGKDDKVYSPDEIYG